MYRVMIKFEIGRRIDVKKDSHKNRKDLKKSKKVNKKKIKNKELNKIFHKIRKTLRKIKLEKLNLIKIQEIKGSTKEERQDERTHKGIEPLDPLTIPGSFNFMVS